MCVEMLLVASCGMFCVCSDEQFCCGDVVFAGVPGERRTLHPKLRKQQRRELGKKNMKKQGIDGWCGLCGRFSAEF